MELETILNLIVSTHQLLQACSTLPVVEGEVAGPLVNMNRWWPSACWELVC